MNSFTRRNIFLIIGDLIIAVVSVYTAVALYFINYPTGLSEYPSIIIRAILFSLMLLFMCFLVDLYNPEKGDAKKVIITKILSAALFNAMILAAFYYFVPVAKIGRISLFLAICISVMLQSIWHIGYNIILKLPIAASRVLILGTGPIAETMGRILNSANNGVALAGYVDFHDEPIEVPKRSIVGNGDGLLATARRAKAQKIVVSLAERRGTLPLKEVLDCKLNGIDVVDGPSFYEQITGKLLIENMNPSHLIFSNGFRTSAFRSSIKRMLDFIMAFFGIVMSSPILILVAVIIKMHSRGPVIFKQGRVGEGEKIFTIFKFRTMIDGAEEASGPVWSQEGDHRITPMGKLLRKTRIDEIPQLFNVINGDMSFIGPRPERPYFVDELKQKIPYYSERHRVKPGITGWAQVRYKYGDSLDDAVEKLRYDLYYMKYQSGYLDLLIILDTVKVVLFGKGGR